MSKFSKIAAGFFAIVGLSSVSLAAPVVKLYLSLNDAATGGVPTLGTGKWAVYADVSSGDNFGLVSYNFTLTGPTSVSNFSPTAVFSDSNGDNANVNAGFALLRSTTPLTITGSQDTTTPGYIISGFGQVNGTLAPAGGSGWDTVNLPTQASYKSHLLLAKGNFTSTVAFTADPMSFNVLLQALNGVGVASTGAAQIQIQPTVNLAGAVPEPASIGVLALGVVGLIARRRKMA